MWMLLTDEVVLYDVWDDGFARGFACKVYSV